MTPPQTQHFLSKNFLSIACGLLFLSNSQSNEGPLHLNPRRLRQQGPNVHNRNTCCGYCSHLYLHHYHHHHHIRNHVASSICLKVSPAPIVPHITSNFVKLTSDGCHDRPVVVVDGSGPFFIIRCSFASCGYGSLITGTNATGTQPQLPLFRRRGAAYEPQLASIDDECH